LFALLCVMAAVLRAADEPSPLCPVCRGAQIVPILPHKPYVKFESMPAPDPDYPPQWKYCDKCKEGVDPKTAAEEISNEMKEAQERARKRTPQIESLLDGKKTEVFYTPFVTVRSLLPAA